MMQPFKQILSTAMGQPEPIMSDTVSINLQMSFYIAVETNKLLPSSSSLKKLPKKFSVGCIFKG